jgi:hypothetical protein
MASTIQLMNPAFYAKMPKEVRKQALTEMIHSLAVISTVTMLLQAAVGDHDDDEDFTDSNSSNFMKIKIAGKDDSFTTLNFFGPLQSLAVSLSRFFSGKFTKATTGEKEYLGERNSYIDSRWDVLVAYFWNKKSPGIALAETLLDEKRGREVDLDELLVKSVTPMWSHDLMELFEDHPTLEASLFTSLNMLGISTQHFQLEQKQRVEKRKAKVQSQKNKIRHEKYLRDLERKSKKK